MRCCKEVGRAKSPHIESVAGSPTKQILTLDSNNPSVIPFLALTDA